jgi:hypothetical protein
LCCIRQTLLESAAAYPLHKPLNDHHQNYTIIPHPTSAWRHALPYCSFTTLDVHLEFADLHCYYLRLHPFCAAGSSQPDVTAPTTGTSSTTGC